MNVIEDIEKLYARLDDLCRVADRGDVGVSDFLSPRELHYAKVYLKRADARFICFGGYEGAERERIFLLPDYMEGITDANGLAEYGYDLPVGALSIRSAGYRKLTHRDYLGSVLGLGVEREVLGDILVYGDDGVSAAIFCKEELTPFFVSELVKVANEKVKCEAIPLSSVKAPERRMAQINDTVASSRVDCVVGALCSLSREKARAAVTSGLVEVDFEPELRPDRAVISPCILSVRGVGRFRVLSVDDKTKKGRYRLVAEKFL